MNETATTNETITEDKTNLSFVINGMNADDSNADKLNHKFLSG